MGEGGRDWGVGRRQGVSVVSTLGVTSLTGPDAFPPGTNLMNRAMYGEPGVGL